jgi:hypothetical protein
MGELIPLIDIILQNSRFEIESSGDVVLAMVSFYCNEGIKHVDRYMGPAGRASEPLVFYGKVRDILLAWLVE